MAMLVFPEFKSIVLKSRSCHSFSKSILRVLDLLGRTADAEEILANVGSLKVSNVPSEKFVRGINNAINAQTKVTGHYNEGSEALCAYFLGVVMNVYLYH